jgi:N,N'-diacetyllegionaminate synthase
MDAKDFYSKIFENLNEPFIIAEAGINHNGKLEKAFDMIRLAKQAGADAVKFQTFKAEEFVGDPAMTYTYKSQGEMVTESMLEMFKRCEFAPEEWKAIKQCCDREGIIFLSTPQNYTDLELLLDLGIPAIKVGSDDFNNLPQLEKYSQTGLPLILSCGMADMAEIYQALDTVGALDGYPVVLLLCTSQYPTPPEDVNLLKLRTLAGAFPMIRLGFSDHTQGSLASSLAVALGARVFEKHFTLDHDLPGPDHWFSEDPKGLVTWINSIRESFQILGSPVVKPTSKEREMRKIARRSIVVNRKVKAGEPLGPNNLDLKRLGNGIPPTMLSLVIGLKSKKDMTPGYILKWGDFE